MAMFGQIWTVAEKDLRHLVRDRTALIMMFAVPLLLMGLLGAALNGAFKSSATVVTIPVVNHDHGAMTTKLIAALRADHALKVQMKTDTAAVEKSVRNGDQVAAVIIPTGFTSQMQSAHPAAHVTFYTVSNNTTVTAQVAQQAVQGVVQRFAFAGIVAQAVTGAQTANGGQANPSAAQRLASSAVQQLDNSPPVAMKTVNATGRSYNAEDNTVPGYALMFALFALTGGAGSILQEKEDGTFKRLLVAPLPPNALLGGKLLAQFIQTVVQLSVLFVLGSLLFHIDLGESIPALALIIVGTSFAATGLGLILVSFVKNQRQLRPITTLIVLSFSALGGSWWPISIEPQWMQSLSKVTLNSWAMQGFNGLMIFDKSLAGVLPDIAALFVYGVVCFAVARRAFRFVEA
jgi:ABC-2 type transport system permease protein